jgi:hypothetical protein
MKKRSRENIMSFGAEDENEDLCSICAVGI